MKRALYFGYGSGGHVLCGPGIRHTIDPERDVPGFPWSIRHLDTGLLKNGQIADVVTGRVHWTCGYDTRDRGRWPGERREWLAFYWWDRSGDHRPGSNSGFYVEGFTYLELQAAFDFACSQWPDVVARQTCPLVLEGSCPA